MGDVVSLRTERKRAARLRDAEVAAQKRIAHGVSKQKRTLAKAVEQKASRTLDQQRLDFGEGQ